jgi:hypothetical protein
VLVASVFFGSLVAESGMIYTPGSTMDALGVPISGYSDHTAGKGVLLPRPQSLLEDGPVTFGPDRAAIVITSKENLILGTGAELSASGNYGADDRGSVDFTGGNAIDVAIYVGSSGKSSGINVDVRSKVAEIGANGAMVIDGYNAVTFQGTGSLFETTRSAFESGEKNLEVVSRVSNRLDQVIAGPPSPRLPYADNLGGITSWFTGTYVLRGKEPLAEVLASIQPVPLVPPTPLEPEIGGDVEGPDMEALEQLLEELGIGVQPEVSRAYRLSLNTDLRLYKAAEKLQRLIPVLDDAEGTRLAALGRLVGEVVPAEDPPTEEQMAVIAQRLAEHVGDGTYYALAGQWIDALAEYVDILATDIGWKTDASVEFVMGKYGSKFGEDIRTTLFVQMRLQDQAGG